MIDADTVVGESASADFKSSFDPQSKQDWCELIKDIVAMSNSGGPKALVCLSLLYEIARKARFNRKHP